MIPTFDMYVYGSLDAYLGILNAVAMVFNQGTFMTSVYLLGGLLTLTATLIIAASNSAAPAAVLRNFLIFAMLVTTGGIKTTLNVQDVYTGQLNRVDNIPLLLSLPASIATSGVFGVLNKTSTAYQGANASYVSISQGGFMDPLKELLAMRRSLKIGNKPLSDTLNQFVLNCWNNGQAAGNVEDLLSSTDGLNYLLSSGAQTKAWTVNYINPVDKKVGDVLVCADVADKIAIEASNYLVRDVGTTPSLVGSVLKALPSIGPRTGGSLPSITASTLNTNIQGTLNNLGISGQTAQTQMLTIMTLNVLSDAFDCIEESGGNPAKLSSCTSQTATMTQAAEQWKSDAAGNASFFQSVMVPASMFIQMLMIALFPLMFMVAIISPGRALQIMGAFAVMLVWSASWPVVAAAVQWVMQMVLNQDMLNYRSGLTYGNAIDFYNAVSKNLAIGSDMLAATPLIAMSLLMGSAISLNSLATRWSADRVNEKLTAPDIQAPAAASQMSPMNQYNPAASGGIMNGSNLRTLQSQSVSSDQVQSSWSDMVRDARTLSQSKEAGSQAAADFVKANSEADKYSAGVAESIAKNVGLTNTQKEELRQSIGAEVKGGIGIPGTDIKAGVSAALAKTSMSDTQRSMALSHLNDNKVNLEHGEAIEKRLSESMGNFSRATEGTQYQHGVERAKSYMSSAAQGSSTSVSTPISEQDFADKISHLSPTQQSAVFANLSRINAMMARPENAGDAQRVIRGRFGTDEERSAFGALAASADSRNPQLRNLSNETIRMIAGQSSSIQSADQNVGLSKGSGPAPMWNPGGGAPTVGPVAAPSAPASWGTVDTSRAAAGRNTTVQVNTETISNQGADHDKVAAPLTGVASTLNTVTGGLVQFGKNLSNGVQSIEPASPVGVDGKTKKQ